MKLKLRSFHVALAAALTLVPAAALAGKGDKAAAKFKPQGEIVEMFAGIKSGDIDVTFIPKDATEATVLFKNKTGKPVAIKLPDAFAGVPVLAQAAGGVAAPGAIGGPANRAPNMATGGMQGMGGGFGGNPGAGLMGGGAVPVGGVVGGGGGMRNWGPFGGGMIMNVGPEKIVKVKVPVVCLEHGKKDPNPHAKYEIRPIESFTRAPEVIELCKMVGRGEVSQITAQAAAWHLAGGLTFEQLAAKNRTVHHSGAVEKFFSPQELKLAIAVASEANQRGDAVAKEASENLKSLTDK